jgi:hypothetical protein
MYINYYKRRRCAEGTPWGSLTLAGQTKEDKQQFIHKLPATLNSLVGLAVISLQTESLSNLRDLARKMWISAQRASYFLVGVKNCSMISAA